MAFPALPRARVALLDCFIRRVALVSPEPALVAEAAALAEKKKAPSRAAFKRAAELMGAAEVARSLRDPAAAKVDAAWVDIGGRDRVLMFLLKTGSVTKRVPIGGVFTGGSEMAAIFGRALFVGVPAQESDARTITYLFDSMSCARSSDESFARYAFDPSLIKCCSRSCDKAGARSCGRCKSVRYCCTGCQAADWPAHRDACRFSSSLATPALVSMEMPSTFGGSSGSIASYSASSASASAAAAAAVPLLFSRKDTFAYIETAISHRDNRKRQVIGIEFNYALRRTVELFVTDIDANARSLAAAGFPLRRSVDVKERVMEGISDAARAIASKFAFELRVFHDERGRGPGGDMPDALLLYVEGSLKNSHSMLVMTRL